MSPLLPPHVALDAQLASSVWLAQVLAQRLRQVRREIRALKGRRTARTEPARRDGQKRRDAR